MAQQKQQAFIPRMWDYPQFQIRFGNGVWVIFDTWRYCVVEIVKPNTLRRAEEIFNA